jgi:hypothetical protein
MCSGQSRVPAKINLTDRGKPAKIVMGVALHVEGCFGQVILLGNGLEHFVWQPLGKRANSGGIALKLGIGKCVDLEDGELHLFANVEQVRSYIHPNGTSIAAVNRSNLF